MVLPKYISKDVEGNDFIGKRTRSHYKFRSKINHHGTPNSPISIDIDDKSSSSHDEEDHQPNSREYGKGKRKRGRPPLKKDDKVGLNLDVDESSSSSSEDEEQHLEFNRRVTSQEDGGGKRKRGRPPLKKVNKEDLELMKPKGKRLKTKEVQNVLLNAILENGKNAGLNNIASSFSEAFLPLKFKYGIEELSVPEISEEEQEVESLFTNMDFALGVCDIGFEPSCLNKNPFGRTKDTRYYGQFPYNDTNVSDRFQFPDLSYDIRGEASIPNDHFSGTVWDLIPGVARTLYPHQRDGFEFIWKNIAGGIRIDELAKPTESGSGGCIICHAPGTGKTRLAIVFLQSFLRQYPKSRPVIIAPYSMLRTWEEEFDRWNVDIPFFNLNEKELSGKEDLPLLKGQNMKNAMKDEYSIRMAKLLTWSMGKGVLAISYGLFQRLAGDGKSVDEKVRKVFLEQPDLLVLDEGHTARNDKSGIVKVLSKVVTKRRVILSGTPFQNNFEELHTTIALVREEFGVPSCSHLNEERKIEKLRKQIGPFVHVHKGEILRDTLPGLFDSLIVLRPSDMQKYIFAHIARLRTPFLKFDNQISLAGVHPSILCETDSGYAVDKEQETLLKDHRMDLDAGAKIRFLVELIKLCKGERVLVFGQRLPSLNFIGDLLESLFEWTKGRELLYIDGGQDMKERQSLIKLFNNPGSEARVLLASTKACCEGISLVGASRVVLLDVVWNPSVERQAISRAYRLGQQKDVFVYHLIISGTLEEDKFHRQTTKEHYSKLLFSSSSPSENETTMHKKSIGSRMVSEDHLLEAMTHHEKINYMFEKIISQPKADDDMIKSFSC
uniref:Uncharacterized protein n=1 Tax=Chenopodium quinoa TaxID=63459 RepID=A0A803L5U0_CHEQI